MKTGQSWRRGNERRREVRKKEERRRKKKRGQVKGREERKPKTV